MNYGSSTPIILRSPRGTSSVSGFYRHAVTETQTHRRRETESMALTPPCCPQSSLPPPPLSAAIDMGTNSFKLLIAQPHPFSAAGATFVPILRRSDPVVLGRGSSSFSAALDSLRSFRELLRLHGVSPANTRCIATAAVRRSPNRSDFLAAAAEAAGIKIRVISGEEEADLAYRSSLHSFPSFRWRLALCVDIGGGSTEVAVGLGGVVLLARSLTLGHVTLTEDFRGKSVEEMRQHVRSVIADSGVVEDVEKLGFHVAVGSSGTIRALDKASSSMGERKWRLSRRELSGVVEKIGGYSEWEKRKVFKRRSEFIEAGAVLLEEIFESLSVEVMEVSRFGILEGLMAGIVNSSGDVRLGSVVRSAANLGEKKRIVKASNCAAIAKEIFEEIRECDEFGVSLDDTDVEYLEAACLLHNIGLCAAKKGYHKHSYSMIMSGDHLRGYTADEVKLIALLARHHRKKFPNLDHPSFRELSEEAKKKFKFICAIIRVSVALWKYQRKNVQTSKASYSYKVLDIRSVLEELENRNLAESDIDKGDPRPELEYFKMVFDRDLSAILSSKKNEH